MDESKEHNMLQSARQGQSVQAHQTRVEPSLVDPDMLKDFTELFGPEQAQTWLEEFQAGLMAEATRPVAEGEDVKGRRNSIHHLCGRAGFIGFPALHAACVEFLEAAPSNSAANIAYERLRAQARLACDEIDRLCKSSH